MAVKLAELKRPKPQPEFLAIVYQKGELGLFESYKQHLRVAEVLGNKPHQHYRDSLLSLHASIECFLKDVYCIVRFHYLPDLEEFFQRRKEREKNKVTEIVSAESFGHNLKELAQYLQNVCQDLTNNDVYKRFVENLPDYNWTRARYDDPNVENNKTTYETLLRCFKALLLDEILGEWK